jgi:hypothetical protein
MIIIGRLLQPEVSPSLLPSRRPARSSSIGGRVQLEGLRDAEREARRNLQEEQARQHAT